MDFSGSLGPHHRRRVAVLSFVVTGILVPFGLIAQQIGPGAGMRREVLGTVVDSLTRQPLVNASVSVTETRQVVLTNSDGRYRLVGIMPSPATLVFSQLGYAPLSRHVDFSRSSATIDVELSTQALELPGIDVTVDADAAFLAARQTTSVMTTVQVDQNRGQTMVETIRHQPGVSIIQFGPSIAKPVVRGLHSQRIATVNAGVPLEGQQWGAEHAPEVDAFAANEIEVIRGPGTLLYGSGALGGVVRVTPRSLPTEPSVGGELATNSFWNNRQGAASLLLEGGGLDVPLLGALGWRAQVSVRRAGDARTPGYYLPNTGFRELHYSTAIGISRSWGRSELNYSHFGTHLGLYLGAHVHNLDDLQRAMDNPYTTSAFAYDLGHPDQRVRHELVSWRTEINLPRTSRLDVTYGFQYNERREYDSRGFASGEDRPAFGLDLFTHTLEAQYHHPTIGALSGTLGISGVRQGNLSKGRSFLIPQYRLYSGGVFALEELRISRLTITGGVRLDDRWQHAFQYGAPVVISPEDSRSYLGLSGSLGATLHVKDTWSVATTLARAWRPPNVNERFSQGVHHGTAQYELGDSTIGPERSLNVDATLRHLGARTRLELSAYRNRIDDYIFLRPRDPILTVRGTYPAYNYAHADALLRGIEVTGEVTPIPWLSLNANFNIVRGIDRATGDALYDMPADRITVTARFFGESNDRFIAPYFEIGTTRVLKQTRVPPVTIYRLPTAGYGLLDLEVGATAMRLRGLTLEPSLAIRNLLDERYRDYLSRYRLFVDDPGRDIVFRLTMPFGSADR